MSSSLSCFRDAGAAALLAGVLASGQAQAADPVCEVDHSVKFSGLNWESNFLMANIQRFILEKGYGYKTEIESNETLAALQRGDVDVTPEVWSGQIEEAWNKALKSGKVEGVGYVFDAGEGWYVPRYTIERHPQLKRAADLAGMCEVFADPEEPNMRLHLWLLGRLGLWHPERQFVARAQVRRRV